MQPTRLTLVCHAATPAQKYARFADDESVVLDWQRDALSLAGRFNKPPQMVCGPELRTRQTASLFGNEATLEPALRDLDMGRWKGQAIDQLDPHAVRAWFADSAGARHGGESVDGLCERTAQWLKQLQTQPGHVLAVTHPFVIRAVMLQVLHMPVEMIYRIDVAPLSCVELRFTGVWRLRLDTHPWLPEHGNIHAPH
ncbi:histidine phosphatase family protein [Pseudomonas poae]|uniref:Broad specificity phosphatase PhoE n=1 Tax=Pseudomonas poae TaxID=200451 RepID=A0ABY0RCD8_9PSED|nr:histidine phosphatase family protein [Pseudomonas poae]KRP51317.1 phosphoglycerate mutase [Pseudomonas poae]SDN61524.1 Broad specificity phosphatase PhoE [Pseudomonas poae]